jgi:pullulanase
MFYMANKLGAWQIDGDENQGRVSFKIFFPKGFDPEVASIRVAGSFQQQISGHADWDFANGFPLTKDDSRPEGAFWSYTTPIPLNSDFYEYKYLVQFNDGSDRIVSDPCTRYGGSENQNAAIVVGGSRPEDNVINDLSGGRRHLRDLMIYEMNLDDFTAEIRGERAPLDAARDKLNYLRDMGFNAILFMPWTAWQNRDFDWGYAPYQYFAVEYRYANTFRQRAEKISWLKRLISACHDLGLHVIMDGVYNHVSMDFPYKFLYRTPENCPFAGIFGKTFPGLQDLNFNNACTQEFILDVCLYWIEQFKIDGIRFDNTVNFIDPDSQGSKGLFQLLQDIQDYLDQKGEQNFSLTLEHLSMDAANVTNNSRATSYWDNALYERSFQYLWDDQIDSRFLNSLNNRRYLHSSDKIPTIYLGNHDHAYVNWQTGARDNQGAMRWFKTQPYVIALYASPGTPMVQNGQEFGEDHWIPEDDRGTGRRVVPRPLRWKKEADPIGANLKNLYQRMAEIRQQHRVLRTGDFYPDYWEEWQTQFSPEGYGVDTRRQLCIYRRSGLDENGKQQYFIIILNFSSQDQYITAPFPENGVWTDLLSDFKGTWQPNIQNFRLDFIVGSHWGNVFCNAAA